MRFEVCWLREGNTLISLCCGSAMARVYEYAKKLGLTSARARVKSNLSEICYRPVDLLPDVPSFNFDRLSRSFVKDYLFSDPCTARKLRPIIKNGNTFEIFEAMWDMDLAHEFLNPEELIQKETLQKKDITNALAYLMRGNQCKGINNEHALKCYNAAIIVVPHPLVILGRRHFSSRCGSKTSLKSDQEAEREAYLVFDQAMMARALLLYDMQQYKESIQDLEYLCRHACSATQKKIVSNMIALCQKSLSQHSGKKNDDNVAFSYRREPSLRSSSNDSFSNASDASVLAQMGTQNKRSLKTKREIRPGKAGDINNSIGLSICVFDLKQCIEGL